MHALPRRHLVFIGALGWTCAALTLVAGTATLLQSGDVLQAAQNAEKICTATPATDTCREAVAAQERLEWTASFRKAMLPITTTGMLLCAAAHAAPAIIRRIRYGKAPAIAEPSN